jgi:EAL domain-containing protein (putative c-di-GMP-specific phosphodiesterase class I)/GGDEF domain-containing protein
MSLYKQLWIGIALLMTLAFGGSFVVSSISAKAYLQEQLTIKNSDNANALALSLSTAEADPVMLELTLSAQFDTGFYKRILLTEPDGNVMMSREDNSPVVEAPAWFVGLFPLKAEPGIAQIQNGWNQVGTLTLESHSRFAYTALWASTLRLMGYFFVAALIAGVAGSFLLRLITKPLDAVVDQAQAIGERRFITTPEPNTLEFKAVVNSMNTLSSRIRDMLAQEAARLEQWRKDAQLDGVTKLLNRGPFIGKLSAVLDRDDASSSGVLMMIRLPGLIELNRSEGRAVVDSLLTQFGNTLNKFASDNPLWEAGRLNGSDFAVLAPAEEDPKTQAEMVQHALIGVAKALEIKSLDNLPAASTHYRSGEGMGAILTRLDASLLNAEKEGQSTLLVAAASTQQDEQQGDAKDQSRYWRETLENAFTNNDFRLASFPVVSMAGELIHDECPARLVKDGALIPAGEFLPWINRLNLTTKLDKQAVSLALTTLAEKPQHIGVNISANALEDEDFIEWLHSSLKAAPKEASRLWLEIPEYGVYQRLEAFRNMCRLLKPLGCRIGIEHVGQEIKQLGLLHDLGIDYVKIDSSMVRDVDQNPANQTMLRALCTIVHSIGLTAIAELVMNDKEWETLKGLGLDGATGPEAERQRV